MSGKRQPGAKMVATINKHKVALCATPEQQPESPPAQDSDSLSDAASPVPFLCTQDGADGETDVVWNFYTPKAEHTANSRFKNSTPLSRRANRSIKAKVIEKPIAKRKVIRQSQFKSELFQDLIELNQNLHEIIENKKQVNKVAEKQQSGSEDDIFNESPEDSPKSVIRNNSRCLRKNLLTAKFAKPELETALESDDSMNECLIKASQIVEENIINPVPAKKSRFETSKPQIDFKIDNDSMDAILNNIKLNNSVLDQTKQAVSPCIKNDSFDSFFGNINDSTLEQLSQMPAHKNENMKKLDSSKGTTGWTIKELIVHEGSPSKKSVFGRHSSMPESPSVADINKPSTSGMAFGRYNSMPPKQNNNCKDSGDSPIRCTPEEIKKKHQLAREKLLAKRQLPFTQTMSQKPVVAIQLNSKKPVFQPKLPRMPTHKSMPPSIERVNSANQGNETSFRNNKIFNHQRLATTPDKTAELKLVIERKRQEALMKLRRRQPQNKMS